ncbi:hypothetical protein [Flavobacterium piscis]|uniref:GIY-YIG nuclease family protein n=1 Tax=Flavobacterium piscis TaxID=1114874 RepID=A0ABU1YA92_9FLAO|nr:hypothetical protein [Flavobacterium piscis]MDR7210993.1 hypothetical protein [Flavobacterium piscis]
MNNVYLVKDGIINVGCIKDKKNQQVTNTNFYLITFNFKTNYGYIGKRNETKWRLYTSIGQLINKKRYYHFNSLEECVSKLENLNNGNMVIVINNVEIHKYIKIA